MGACSIRRGVRGWHGRRACVCLHRCLPAFLCYAELAFLSMQEARGSLEGRVVRGVACGAHTSGAIDEGGRVHLWVSEGVHHVGGCGCVCGARARACVHVCGSGNGRGRVKNPYMTSTHPITAFDPSTPIPISHHPPMQGLGTHGQLAPAQSGDHAPPASPDSAWQPIAASMPAVTALALGTFHGLAATMGGGAVAWGTDQGGCLG